MCYDRSLNGYRFIAAHKGVEGKASKSRLQPLLWERQGGIRDTFSEPADGMTIHPAPIINLFQLKPSERPS